MTPMEKLTERLNTALREHGYTVFERELSYAEGGQRQMDCWRWEGVARQANLPSTIKPIGSYDTVSECARRGVTFMFYPRYIDVTALPKSSVERDNGNVPEANRDDRT